MTVDTAPDSMDTLRMAQPAGLASKLTELRDQLLSPQGREARQAIGTVMVITAPWLARMLFGRRSRLMRAAATLLGAIAIAKAGEVIRSWEPRETDVPGYR